MSERNSTLSPRLARIAAVLLAIVGLQAWLILGNGDYGHRHEFSLLLAAILVSLIPQLRNGFDRIWQAIATPSPRTRNLISCVLAVLSFPFLLWMQIYQHTQFHLIFQDEFSYWLQMHMLAHGRLWMPALPLPEFFDSFYIFVRPVYASMYFPGTALLYLPVIFLHFPYYTGPLVACSICVGLVYWIICEILDGGSAALTVIVLLCITMFRLMSIMLLSEAPMLLMGLLMTFAYLHWRKNKSPRWALLLGITSGWAAIIRPADALCFALAIGISFLCDLRDLPRKLWIQTATLLIFGAVPFLSLQLIFNHAVTGHFLSTPFSLYTDQNYPGANFGFHPLPPDNLHVSDTPQKQEFFHTTVMGNLRAHQIENIRPIAIGRLSQFIGSGLPDPFLWFLIPISLLAIWDRRRWAIWGPLIFFVIVYTFYPWWISNYATPLFPAVLLLILSPIQWLSDNFPNQRPWIRTFLGVGIIALSIASLPQFDRLMEDQYYHMTALAQIDADLSARVTPPAIVLFHFNPGQDNPEQEPVYNSDVTWPDDAPIIRAHDLNPSTASIGHPGDRNGPLYGYYATVSPNRVIYLYDRSSPDPQPIRLGTPYELLRTH